MALLWPLDDLQLISHYFDDSIAEKGNCCILQLALSDYKRYLSRVSLKVALKKKTHEIQVLIYRPADNNIPVLHKVSCLE